MTTLHSFMPPHYAHLTANSREVKPGSVFVAYPGEVSDGRLYIKDAIEKGAGAILWESDSFDWHQQINSNIPNQGIQGLKKQLGNIASDFYGNPSKELRIIGVTGTNGKTSCTHWIASALKGLGYRSAVIGTLGNGPIGDALAKTNNTTPDAIHLQQMLAQFVRDGIDSVAMEVSSHGLDQGRVNGVLFEVAVFTNLTRDHLDYHKDMESYANAKRLLFAWDSLKAAVINRDDVFGMRLASELQARGQKVITYGLDVQYKGGQDIGLKSLTMTDTGMRLEISSPLGEATLESKVMGRFNAYNVLAVLGSLLSMGIEYQDAIKAISWIEPVPGRMQHLGGGTAPLIVVDYAHTPDALNQVLQALKIQTKNQLICVFGCGGERDKGKRSLMGEIACKVADKVIVTADNPRGEPVQDIIRDILQGCDQKAMSIESREQAIQAAIEEANAGDVILLAGKGHEAYQEISGVKHPFSDEKFAKKFLTEKFSTGVLQ
jgi:UDP-N-acetylmuramyl-tripeptide synthetase